MQVLIVVKRDHSGIAAEFFAIMCHNFLPANHRPSLSRNRSIARQTIFVRVGHGRSEQR